MLGLREKSEKLLSKKGKSHANNEIDDDNDDYDGGSGALNKVKIEMESIAREALHSVVVDGDNYEGNDNNHAGYYHHDRDEDEDDDDNTRTRKQEDSFPGGSGSSSSLTAIDFTSVMLQKKKKRKKIADDSGMSMNMGLMDWTSKSI